MLALRVLAMAAGAVVGALLVGWFGLWEPGRGFWQWEPLLAVGGVGVLAAEIAAIIADSGERPRGSSSDAG